MADKGTGRRLYRSDDAMVAGVCAGIAEYFSTSKTLIRVIAAALFVLGIGSPILVYIVMAILVPKKPSDFTEPVEVEPVPTVDGIPVAIAETGEPVAEAEPDACPADTAQPLGAAYSATYGTSLDVDRGDGRNRRWLRWPIIVSGALLVCLGCYLLISKAAPGVAPWRLWPVFIILCGAVIAVSKGRREHHSAVRVLVGLLVMGLGAVLLMCTLGIFGWGVWFSILALWPLALVGCGVVLVGLGAANEVAGSIGAVVLIGMVALGCVNYHYGMHVLVPADSIVQNSSGLYRTKTIAKEAPISLSLADYDVTDLDFKYTLGGAETYLCANDTGTVDVYGGGNLAQIAFYEPDMLGRGGLVIVRRKPSAASTVLSPTVCLSTQIAWDTLEFTGDTAANLCIDLDGLTVGDIDIETQVTDLDVMLNEPSDNDDHVVFIGQTTTQLGVTIPDGCAVSVFVDGPFSSSDLSSTLHYDASTGCWVNDAYDDALCDGGPIWYVIAAYGTQTLSVAYEGGE